MELGENYLTASEFATDRKTNRRPKVSAASNNASDAIPLASELFISSALSPDDLIDIYRSMYRIRRFEETCGQHYASGHIRGFLHLYIGQEATGVGSISALEQQDYVVTHYRDHGHALARGIDANRVMAEMFGRAAGVSKGKGGSMHIFDAAKRFMGGHAIVGAQLPLAAGIALAQQYLETNAVTIVYFGDGATNQGTFHETLNLASVWRLPILFFMENNLYGMGSAVGRVRVRGNDFTDAMAAYDINAISVDGMDVLAVREATESALQRIRAHGSPLFIEAKTFRFVGHSYADRGDQYRPRSEIEEWKKRDPIVTYPKHLVKSGIATKTELSEVIEEVNGEIEAAVKFALQTPDPDLSELLEDIYA